MAEATPFDVVTIGRVGVDVYPLQVGVGLEDVETFGKFVGGSATNVAVAAARHGLAAAVITRTGDDPLGRFVRRELADLGVDVRWITTVPDLPTPITLCEMFPPDHFPIYFYRWPKAPDLEIAADELDLAALAAARLVWVTVTGLCDEPSRSAHHAALAARGRRHPTVLDLDYRPTFWPDRETARREVARVLPLVSVAVGNRDECLTAVGTDEPDLAAERLLAQGVELAVVKLGPEGVLGRTAGERVVVPPRPVEVVNGLGAGDGFGGALALGLLSGWPLERMLTFANAAGSIVAGRLECSTAMPTTAEVEAVLTEVPR